MAEIFLYLAVIIIAYCIFKRDLIRRLCITFPRDIRIARKFIGWQLFFYYSLFKRRTILSYFYDRAKLNPDDVAFIGIESETYTYHEFECLSNKIARYFEQEGYKPGDCISLVMESRSAYILIWYSLAKIRVITSFINTNLVGDQLTYCIDQSNSKAVIFSRNCETSIKDLTIVNKPLYNFDGNSIIPLAINIPEQILCIEDKDFPPRALPYDVLCYIFTSGSMGFPKAVIVNHIRAFHYCQIGYMVDMCSSDRFYTFMPLYHLNSGVIVTGISFIFGIRLVIRTKFSASRFTQDCIQHNVNCFNYVGEVCSYLHNTPPSAQERQLRFKFIMGNGLRKCIWAEFKERFHIDRIIEVYGSSEGNASAINLDNTIGACGYYPIWFTCFKMYCLVKCDLDGNFILDKNGKAVLANYNEIGHLVGKIIQSNTSTRFDGYLNRKDNNKKIRNDVFKKGDSYFITGDLLKMDEYGYLYFYDRIGDTFRWKGENVSTNELETYLLKYPNILDVVVYGVTIPEHEGKAGMAAVKMQEQSDTSTLDEYVKMLPSYQKPVFIRLMDDITLSNTMKYVKIDLKREGFDIKKYNNIVYVRIKNEGYKPLTLEIYNDILKGKISF